MVYSLFEKNYDNASQQALRFFQGFLYFGTGECTYFPFPTLPHLKTKCNNFLNREPFINVV